MKCPRCKFVTSNRKDLCPQCHHDLRQQKAALGLPIFNPTATVAELIAEIAGTEQPASVKKVVSEVATRSAPQKTSWLGRIMKRGTPPSIGPAPTTESQPPLSPSPSISTPAQPPPAAERPAPLIEDTKLWNLEEIEDEPVNVDMVLEDSAEPLIEVSSTVAVVERVASPPPSEVEVTPVAPEALPPCRTEMESALPVVAPPILDFAEDESILDEQLDELLGDTVVNVQSVKVEHSMPAAEPDELEFSFEVESSFASVGGMATAVSEVQAADILHRPADSDEENSPGPTYPPSASDLLRIVQYQIAAIPVSEQTALVRELLDLLARTYDSSFPSPSAQQSETELDTTLAEYKETSFLPDDRDEVPSAEEFDLSAELDDLLRSLESEDEGETSESIVQDDRRSLRERSGEDTQHTMIIDRGTLLTEGGHNPDALPRPSNESTRALPPPPVEPTSPLPLTDAPLRKTSSLWDELDDDLARLEPAGESELSLSHFAAEKADEHVSLLFDLARDEIDNPVAHNGQVAPTSETRQVDSKELEESFRSFDRIVAAPAPVDEKLIDAEAPPPIELAPFHRRLFGAVVDGVFSLGAALVIGSLSFIPAETTGKLLSPYPIVFDEILPLLFPIAILILLVWMLSTAFLAWGRGQTVGQRIARLTVCDIHGMPLNLLQAILFAFCQITTLLTGGLGFLTSAGPRRLALHDQMAKVRVTTLG